MGLTTLGIFHTIIGIVALGGAIVSFVKYSKVNLAVMSGKTYFYGTCIASLTALGLSKEGGLNPGHGFALFIFILVLTSLVIHSRQKKTNRAGLLENLFLSLSFFLSLVPTVAETFQRVPLGHPLAKSPADPVIAKTLGVLFVLFIVGSVYQYLNRHKINKPLR